MARAGRALETLVAILEKSFAPFDVVVDSPAHIKGRRSGSTREVDVAVRGRLGATELLVIMECRDRAGIEDVRWIEELATKRTDVGADKAVAVSTSGFSSGAESLAAAEGIELRTLESIEVSSPFSWLGLTHLDVSLVRFGLGDLSIDVLDPKDEVIAALRKRDMSNDEQLFIEKSSGRSLTSRQVLGREILRAPAHQVALSSDGSTVTTELELRFAGNDIVYQIMGPAGLVDVHTIRFDILLAAERSRIPIDALSSYVRDDSLLTENAQFRFTVDGDTWLLSLHLLKDTESLVASLHQE